MGIFAMAAKGRRRNGASELPLSFCARQPVLPVVACILGGLLTLGASSASALQRGPTVSCGPFPGPNGATLRADAARYGVGAEVVDCSVVEQIATQQPSERAVNGHSCSPAEGESPYPGWRNTYWCTGGNHAGWSIGIYSLEDGGGTPTPAPSEAAEPGQGPPTPTVGCKQPKLKIGPVEVKASCWTKSKTGGWSAKGAIRAGGVDIRAAGFSANPGAGKLSANGSATASVGSVTLFKGNLSWNLATKLHFGVATGSKIKGLPIEGSVAVHFGLSSAAIDIHVGLPAEMGGVRGDARLTASSATGLSLNGLKLAVGEFRVASKLKVRKASLAYSSAGGDQWAGEILAELPGFPNAVTIDGKLVVLNGGFKSARLDVSGFNKPICCAAPAVFLQSVGFGVEVDPLVVSGSLGLSAGPRVLGGTALSLSGSAELRFGSPDEYRLSGAMKVAEVSMANGEVVYRTSGSLDFSGKAQFSKFGFEIDGEVEGWVDGLRAFNAEGKVTVSMPRVSSGGEGLISSQGVVACRRGWGPDVGASYRWGERPHFFGRSCGLGELREPRASAAQTATPGFSVPAGDRLAVVALTGRDAPPSLTITGPDGETVTTPAGGGAVDDGRFLLIRVPSDKTTYVAIDRPTAGFWKISTSAGASPLVQVRQARPLPAVKVHAKVRKAKHGRVLTWTLTRIPGQRVTFIERGRNTVKKLTATTHSRGSARFAPALGSGKRIIEALVEQDGLPREVRRLTPRYTVRAAAIGKPRTAKLTRKAGSLHLTWSRARNAAQYEVAVRLTDGRRLSYTTTAKRRRVTIPRVRARTRVRVSIIALDALNHKGRPRTINR